MEHFVGLSFPTISSSGPNGAIIHYRPEEETARTLNREELYLVDSGAQYKVWPIFLYECPLSSLISDEMISLGTNLVLFLQCVGGGGSEGQTFQEIFLLNS